MLGLLVARRPLTPLNFDPHRRKGSARLVWVNKSCVIGKTPANKI